MTVSSSSVLEDDCICNCLCSVIVLCGMTMMKGREKVKPLDLTSPSDGRIAINSTICLLNIHTAEGCGI